MSHENPPSIAAEAVCDDVPGLKWTAYAPRIPEARPSQDEHYYNLSKNTADSERASHELDYLLADDLGMKAEPAQPTNPKQAFGDTKVPLHLFPATAIAVGCLSFLEGKGKYGGWNFRASPIEAMTYVRACDGHMKAYAEGRDIDPDSGLPELGKALACIAILIDATAAGTLIDNRNHNGAGYLKLVKELEAHVGRLRDLHADKNPKHYTIADNKDAA